MALSSQSRIYLVGLLTGIFFVVELVAGLATSSSALIADSFHMLSDIASLVVSIVALRLARSASTPTNLTYGYKRAQVVGAFANGIILLSLSFSIVVEAITRIVEGSVVKQPVVVLIVGCAGLAMNVVGMYLFTDVHHGHSHTSGGEHIKSPHGHGFFNHGHAHGADHCHDEVIHEHKHEAVEECDRRAIGDCVKGHCFEVTFSRDAIVSRCSHASGSEHVTSPHGHGFHAHGALNHDHCRGEMTHEQEHEALEECNRRAIGECVKGHGCEVTFSRDPIVSRCSHASGSEYVTSPHGHGFFSHAHAHGALNHDHCRDEVTHEHEHEALEECNQRAIGECVKGHGCEVTFSRDAIGSRCSHDHGSGGGTCSDAHEVTHEKPPHGGPILPALTTPRRFMAYNSSPSALTLSLLRTTLPRANPTSAPPPAASPPPPAASPLNTRALFLHALSDAAGNIAVIVSAIITLLIHAHWRSLVDPLATLLIAGLSASIAIPLIKSTGSLLLLASGTVDVTSLTASIAASSPRVLRVESVRVWWVSEDECVGSCTIKLYNSLGLEESKSVIDGVKNSAAAFGVLPFIVEI